MARQHRKGSRVRDHKKFKGSSVCSILRTGLFSLDQIEGNKWIDKVGVSDREVQPSMAYNFTGDNYIQTEKDGSLLKVLGKTPFFINIKGVLGSDVGTRGLFNCGGADITHKGIACYQLNGSSILYTLTSDGTNYSGLNIGNIEVGEYFDLTIDWDGLALGVFKVILNGVTTIHTAPNIEWDGDSKNELQIGNQLWLSNRYYIGTLLNYSYQINNLPKITHNCEGQTDETDRSDTVGYTGVLNGTLTNFNIIDFTTGNYSAANELGHDYANLLDTIYPLNTLEDSIDFINQETDFIEGIQKWVIFGDSFSSLRYPEDYPSYVTRETAFEDSVTHAVGGDTTTQGRATIDALIASDPNYFQGFTIASIHLGINDFGTDKILGDINDTSIETTVAGNTMAMIEAIQLSNSNIIIHLITPPEGNSVGVPFETDNGVGWSVIDMSVLYNQIASLYGINIINMHDETGWSAADVTANTSDGLHPNIEGCKVLSTIVSRRIGLRKGTYLGKVKSSANLVKSECLTFGADNSVRTENIQGQTYMKFAITYKTLDDTGTRGLFGCGLEPAQKGISVYRTTGNDNLYLLIRDGVSQQGHTISVYDKDIDNNFTLEWSGFAGDEIYFDFNGVKTSVTALIDWVGDSSTDLVIGSQAIVSTRGLNGYVSLFEMEANGTSYKFPMVNSGDNKIYDVLHDIGYIISGTLTNIWDNLQDAYPANMIGGFTLDGLNYIPASELNAGLDVNGGVLTNPAVKGFNNAETLFSCAQNQILIDADNLNYFFDVSWIPKELTFAELVNNPYVRVNTIDLNAKIQLTMQDHNYTAPEDIKTDRCFLKSNILPVGENWVFDEKTGRFVFDELNTQQYIHK